MNALSTSRTGWRDHQLGDSHPDRQLTNKETSIQL